MTLDFISDINNLSHILQIVAMVVVYAVAYSMGRTKGREETYTAMLEHQINEKKFQKAKENKRRETY